MSRKIKLLIIAGARPNFMKVAPLIKSVRAYGTNGKQNGVSFEYKLVHTGQHYDAAMSDSFFQDLDLPTPDRHLGVGSGSHAAQTGAVMERFEPVVLEEDSALETRADLAPPEAESVGPESVGEEDGLDSEAPADVAATRGPDATEIAAVEGEVDLDVDHPEIAEPDQVPAGIPVEPDTGAQEGTSAA